MMEKFFNVVYIIGLIFIFVSLFIIVATAQFSLTFKVLFMGGLMVVWAWCCMLCVM